MSKSTISTKAAQSAEVVALRATLETLERDGKVLAQEIAAAKAIVQKVERTLAQLAIEARESDEKVAAVRSSLNKLIGVSNV